jgi:two-component system, NarL family, response regulator LiaR
MNKIRIVLIEDHDLTRLGLRTTFQQSDKVEVLGEAVNGQEGLRLLERTRPDVAVVDIGLPVIDGIELTRQFKQMLTGVASAQFITTKIMMLTMQDSQEAVLAAFAAGADSYCLKDTSSQTLLKALENTYEGNNWIDPAIARIILQNANPLQPHAMNVATSNRMIAIAADESMNQLIEAYPLTERELEILEQIVAGCSNTAIANKLYITVGTVKTHVRNILNKLCVDDRTQAAVRALRAGLIS